MLDQRFLSNYSRCNCFATPLRGATKFANYYHTTKSYSILRNKNTDTKTVVQRAFCTQLYTKTLRSVDFCVGRSGTKHEHSQQLYRQNPQPRNLGFENASDLLQCLTICLDGNSARWLRVQSFAKCTLHSC